MRLTVVAVLLSWCIAGCAALAQRAPPLQPDARSPLVWAEVLRLRSARDYFTFRDRLEAAGPNSTPVARFARAVVEHALNEPAASNATIAALLAESTLPDSLAADLRQIQLTNHLRLFQYAAGLATADTLLADSVSLDPAERRDVRNVQQLFRALANVPPQTSEVRGSTMLRLERGLVPAHPARQGRDRRALLRSGRGPAFTADRSRETDAESGRRDAVFDFAA